MSRIPVIVVLAAIALIDALAFSLVLPLLPVVLHREHTAVWLMVLVFASFSICQIVAAPQLGRLADRIGRRPVLVLSQVGTLIGFLLMAWAPSAGWLLPGRVLDGLTAGNLAVVFAIVCDLYGDAERTRAFAIINAAQTGGVLLGLATAAALANRSFSLLALLAAGASGVTVLLALLARYPKPAESVVMTVRRALRLHPALRRPAAGVVASQLVMTALTGVITLLLVAIADVTPRSSLLITFFALLAGGSLQGVLAGPVERRFGATNSVVVAAAVVVAGLLLMAVAAPRPVAVAVAMVPVVAGVLWLMSATTAVLSSSTSLGAGLVMGVNQSLAAIGQLLGPALALVVLSLGWGWLFVLLAVTALVAAVVVSTGSAGRVEVVRGAA